MPDLPGYSLFLHAAHTYWVTHAQGIFAWNSTACLVLKVPGVVLTHTKKDPYPTWYAWTELSLAKRDKAL